MKLAATFVSILPAASAFSSSRPAFAARLSLTSLAIGRDSNVDLGGNSWKPDSEKMGVRSHLLGCFSVAVMYVLPIKYWN